MDESTEEESGGTEQRNERGDGREGEERDGGEEVRRGVEGRGDDGG